MIKNARLPIPADVGVVELGPHVFAFSRDSVAVLRDGAVVHRVPGTWSHPVAITLADRAGTWVVAISNGQLLRILPDGDPEPVGAQFGLADERVLAIAATGTAFVIGLERGAIASADGSHVKRFPGAPAPLVAAARHMVAIGRTDHVELMDLTAGTLARFAVRAPTQLGFLDPDGTAPRLVVFDGRDVFVETAGALQRLPTDAPVRQLALAGAGLWLAVGSSLHAHDGKTLRPSRLTLREPARIFGAPSGDVWIAAAELVRFTTDTARDASWQRDIAPVFERACARCHRPGGADDAGVDLSSASRWRALRSEIIDRVLTEQDMPPREATSLTAGDRRTLERWLAP